MPTGSPPQGRLRRHQQPATIVCMARTFAAHARELGNTVPEDPIFFLKPRSAVITDGEPIVIPHQSDEVHHEAEVAVLIGSTLTRASVTQAEEAIEGWTVANDVTARDLQRADNGRFTRAKGFDSFFPISPVILPALSWREARIQCLLDGTLRQDALLASMSFSPAELVSQVSQVMTLEAGDVVSLGTPSGVGPMRPGQVVTVRLLDSRGETLIELTNPVAIRGPDGALVYSELVPEIT